jgi:hypothetical protein
LHKSLILKFLFTIFFFILVFKINSNENIKTDDKYNKYYNKYNEDKITYETKQEFDPLYPLNINNFYFYKGDKRLSFNEFLDLSKDPYLIKNQEKVKKIKLAGHTTAIVSSIAGAAFLIPGIIFIVNQTNYRPVDGSYLLSGVGMIAMTGVSGLVLIIDLIVTYSLLYKFQFNEYAVKQAVERYNENLRMKLKIVPELSYQNDNIIVGVNLKLKA